uniref:ATP-citrate synthase beta chain protein 1 n=1 Tax=Tanacetum cinerariifolium TaxID=118510 RepID=A0A699HX99_TANCI|nr:ATP-citrate synthase beta chain protein 1 [Tanacetum cinerariifolium]
MLFLNEQHRRSLRRRTWSNETFVLEFLELSRQLLQFRSAAASSKLALKQPTIRVVAIIAEGVPQSDTKELISYASHSKERLIGHIHELIVGNKMHKAFPLLEESSHWQYKFPLPVEGVPTARRIEITLPGVCTAMMQKLPVKEN